MWLPGFAIPRSAAALDIAQMIQGAQGSSASQVIGRSIDLIPEDESDGLIRHTFLSDDEVAWEIVGGELDGLSGVESCEIAVEDAQILASWRERLSGFAVYAVYDLARAYASLLLCSPAVHRLSECRLVTDEPDVDLRGV
jgi:predicted secreted protein